jgi:hypothetical protein
VIFISKVEVSIPGLGFIFRHNKHLNFYRTENIRRLMLGKFLNFKAIELSKKSPDHVEFSK